MAQADRLWLLLALVVVVVAVGLWMQRIAGPMRAAGGPGIVPFELAEDAREARRILTRWGPAGRSAATRQTLVDFLFLAAYGAALCDVAAYVGGRATAGHCHALHAVAVAFSWLAVAAAGCDAVEDVAMLVTLRGFAPVASYDAPPVRPAYTTSVQVSRVASRAKFALVALCTLFVPVGIAWLNLR